MGWIIAALAALAVSLLAFTWYLLKLGWYLLVFLCELALAAGRFVGTLIEAYQERRAAKAAPAISAPAPARRRRAPRKGEKPSLRR